MLIQKNMLEKVLLVVNQNTEGDLDFLNGVRAADFDGIIPKAAAVMVCDALHSGPWIYYSTSLFICPDCCSY